MRITVDLDDDVARALRAIAFRTHRSFSQVLNDMLREGIAASALVGKHKAKRFIVKARSMGPLLNFDPISLPK